MRCPICDSPLRPGAERCPDCGFRVSPQSAVRPASRREDRPPRRRGCCVGAALIPVICFVLFLASVLFSAVAEVVSDSIREPGHVPAETALHIQPDSQPEPADGAWFSCDGGTLMFHPESWDGSPVLQIPESVDGETVTAIGPGCFQDCTGLTTILLPDTVTEIQTMAFSGCTELRGLYLPEGMESISTDAFDGCVALEAICIPETVTSIAQGCFDDCASLLYIIYDGSFERWDALYDDYINPFTTAICLDGNYYHGAGD